MKRVLVVVSGLILLLLFFFGGYIQSQDVSNYIKDAPPMKNVVTGKEIKLSDYINKVLVLEFFETWCPACNHAIPELIKFYQEIQNNSNLRNKVVFFSIVSPSSGDEKYIKEFIKSKGISYPVLLELKPQLSYKLGVRYIPTLFVIKDRKIVYSKIGPEQAQILMQNLLKFIK